MKIWKSFSGEHSANLRIIGTFKTEKDAVRAVSCFNDLIAVENKGKGDNVYFSEELMEVFKKHNFHAFTENDPQQLDLYYDLKSEGNEIIFETDELEIQALLKVLLQYGAKVQVYSKHDYPTK